MYRFAMQIDHDPRELSRTAIRLVMIVTAMATLLLMIPISFGIRWVVDLLPIEITLLVTGIALGTSVGFFLGRWDALGWPNAGQTCFGVVAGRIAFLLLRAPFAFCLLPIASYAKAKREGETPFVQVTSALLGGVVGLMITMATAMIIIVPIQIALGY